MKAKLVRKFEPLTVEFELETVEEVRAMYHLLNHLSGIERIVSDKDYSHYKKYKPYAPSLTDSGLRAAIGNWLSTRGFEI